MAVKSLKWLSVLLVLVHTHVRAVLRHIVRISVDSHVYLWNRYRLRLTSWLIVVLIILRLLALVRSGVSRLLVSSHLLLDHLVLFWDLIYYRSRYFWGIKVAHDRTRLDWLRHGCNFEEFIENFLFLDTRHEGSSLVIGHNHFSPRRCKRRHHVTTVVMWLRHGSSVSEVTRLWWQKVRLSL